MNGPLAEPGTLRAMNGDTTVTFTDYVDEGEVVDIYRTLEAAEAEEGPTRKMVVCRDEDDWWLEPVAE